MTLLTVVQDVCAAVGVDRPTSVFSNINYNRTMTEMLALANEMAQRIAYDTRDWTGLYAGPQVFTGDGVKTNFPLPANFKRLLLSSQVWRSTSTQQPMRFIPDFDVWLQRRVAGIYSGRGEWIIAGGEIAIAPVLAGAIPPGFSPTMLMSPWATSQLYSINDVVVEGPSGLFWYAKIAHTSAAAGTFAEDRAAHPGYWAQPVPAVTAYFVYLDKNCIALASGGYGDSFLSDFDTFRQDERILKLGMIFQWKALKGSPYAEDLGSYNDALDRVAGADKPAPIIVGRLPISAAARVGYPFPIDPGMVPL